MPKKSSSMKPTRVQEQENPVVKQKNPSSKPEKSKKSANEIDQIFSGKKRKKVEKTEKANGDESQKPKLMKKNKKINEDKECWFADPPAQSRKKTGDGFTIYTEEELGITKADAGGTRLCPFDCDCCF